VSDNTTQEPGNSTPAAGLRLRPERPRVTRLSRKMLAALAGVASLAILRSVIRALDSKKRGQPMSPELFNIDNRTTPDGLASLPKDYGAVGKNVPQLGPPLPADLGRPILNARAATPPASGLETAE